MYHLLFLRLQNLRNLFKSISSTPVSISLGIGAHLPIDISLTLGIKAFFPLLRVGFFLGKRKEKKAK
jgi:hypothetical protein